MLMDMAPDKMLLKQQNERKNEKNCNDGAQAFFESALFSVPYLVVRKE